MQISNSYASVDNAYKGVSRQNSATEYESVVNSTNAFTQNAYTITATRVQKTLQEGKVELIYPTPSQTPFSSVLNQKQVAVSASEYDLAVSRVVELMSELSSFVTAKQGEDSELSYYISTMSEFFAGQTKFNQEHLNAIKTQITKGDESAIVQAINAYFAYGASTAEHAMNFFDYASDKIEGLPTKQIMQDLATIKGYWDNNSRENLTLDDGTKVGISDKIDPKTNARIQELFISTDFDIEFKENTIQSQKFSTLLEMFKNRENLNSTNANLSQNLSTNLNSNTLNSNKTNSNRLNSSDNLLKALLNSILNDENSLKNLRI